MFSRPFVHLGRERSSRDEDHPLSVRSTNLVEVDVEGVSPGTYIVELRGTAADSDKTVVVDPAGTSSLEFPR